MTEYMNVTPEFESWKVWEAADDWRMGKRISVVREGWALRWRLAVVAVGLGAGVLGAFSLVAMLRAEPDRAPTLFMQSLFLSALAVLAIRDFTKLIELIEKQPVPTGELRSPHCDSLAMAYSMRAEALRAQGEFAAADRDEERAAELVE